MHVQVVGSTRPPMGRGSLVQGRRYQTCYSEFQAQMPVAAAWLEGSDNGVEHSGLLVVLMMLLQPMLHLEVHSSVPQSRPTVPRTALLPGVCMMLALGSRGRNSPESRRASMGLGLHELGGDFRRRCQSHWYLRCFRQRGASLAALLSVHVEERGYRAHCRVRGALACCHPRLNMDAAARRLQCSPGLQRETGSGRCLKCVQARLLCGLPWP